MEKAHREQLVGTLDELLGRVAACQTTRDYLGDTVDAVRAARRYFAMMRTDEPRPGGGSRYTYIPCPKCGHLPHEPGRCDYGCECGV